MTFASIRNSIMCFGTCLCACMCMRVQVHMFIFVFSPHITKRKLNMCICAHILLGFPDISAGKESTCNSGDLGVFTGLGRSPEEGNSYPLHYSVLENSGDCLVGLKVGHD